MEAPFEFGLGYVPDAIEKHGKRLKKRVLYILLLSYREENSHILLLRETDDHGKGPVLAIRVKEDVGFEVGVGKFYTLINGKLTRLN